MDFDPMAEREEEEALEIMYDNWIIKETDDWNRHTDGEGLENIFRGNPDSRDYGEIPF